MFRFKIWIISFAAILMAFAGQTAQAEDIRFATPAVAGYDVVSYHTANGPQRGSGYFVAEHDGVTYLFANEQNKELFLSNPEKYLPAYGGYCAYGVAVGKKFHIDPLAWRLVDGKLYLNLDADIQKKWQKDIPGYIEKADANWTKIKDKEPSAL